jgi:hypothetical protein
MSAAKAVIRVPVPDLCCLWAETEAALMNIALIAIFDGGALTGPGGEVRLAAIRSFIAAHLDRAPALRRVLCSCPPGPVRAGWPGARPHRAAVRRMAAAAAARAAKRAPTCMRRWSYSRSWERLPTRRA